MKQILDWEHEPIVVRQSVTVGRHLDNDLIASGEDVLDYHLRLEPHERGLSAHPLNGATLTVNGREFAQAVGLMVGDKVSVGSNTGIVSVEYEATPQADRWVLISGENARTYTIDHELIVGRTDEADIVLPDDHISRNHARLLNHHQHIWLQDLGSANGSFINGKKLIGAQLLYHGDRIAFDTFSMQLIGKGADLTPVRAQAAAATERAVMDAPVTELRVDTTRVSVINEQLLAALEVPVSDATGAFLLGASVPIAGQAFRIPAGRSLVGRDAGCDLMIRDSTVSSKHAELMLRAEGCSITNLLSTNGVRVNGRLTQTSQLVHGDTVRLGNVSFVFNDVPRLVPRNVKLKRVQVVLIVASITLALTIAWMFS